MLSDSPVPVPSSPRGAAFSHSGCMVCGSPAGNPHSLALAFDVQDDGSVAGEFVVTARHQGYDGLMHGGMTTTLLDAAMTHALFALDIRALTAELSVRFVAPIALGDRLRITARRTSNRRQLHIMAAEICCQEQVVAQATARFMAVAAI